MREIKFRAWDINQKKMIDLKKLSPFALDSRFENDALVIPFVDNLVLQQFTGLKDKNGKEIFEGDVVQLFGIWVYPIENIPSIGYVKFGGGSFFVEEIKLGFAKVNVGIGNDKSIEEFVTEFYGYEGQKFSFEDTEVIGNIYENPELLEGKE